MPTAGRLLAAVAFALVGFLGAEVYKALMPELSEWGSFSQLSAMLGAFCGWKVMGPRAGGGWRRAMGAGVSTSAVLVGLALLLFSGREMVLRSLRGRYDGPLDATVGTFGVAIEQAAPMMDASFLGVMVLGGALGGLMAEAGQRRWR